MKVVLDTAPTIYPVTLAEVKMQLRLDSGTLEDNLTTSQSLAPASHAIGTHNGTGVDVLGHEAIVYLDSGVASGTNNTKIQECDTLAGTYTDWTGGAFTAVTGANDEAIQEIEYTGTKQYIRTTSTVTVDACIFGTQVVTNAATFAEDTLLTNLIIAATEWAEGYTRRKFITQTWNYCLDEFPDVDYIRIPYGNLQSVPSIKYWGPDANETTMTVTDEYLVETNGANYGRIVLPYGYEVWPSDLYPSNPITIKFVCGYGAVASSVPYRIKAAILRLVAKMYESRGEDVLGQTVREDTFVRDLLYPIRLWDDF
jgi:uncharacterized phiE125 gp8 family phage protein